MSKVSQEKGKVSTQSLSTLVLDPTVRSPIVSFYVSASGKRAKKVWQQTVSVAGPGHVSYWPILLSKQKSLPPDRILVITGPGPFTATRAAVNIANAFGYAWDRPVLGASAAEVKKRGLANILKQSMPATFDLRKRALPFYSSAPY
jgi:tRNA A37 threonylcarbamoyladenosine modification protein TsaB